MSDTNPIEQSATPAPAPAAEEIRAIAVHRNFAWEVRAVDYNVSCICFKRADIVKIFEREFKRREMHAARIGMPLSPADPKYAEFWNAAADAEQQRLGRVVVRVIESSERKSSIDEKPPNAPPALFGGS
jgi:hypothetical protein